MLASDEAVAVPRHAGAADADRIADRLTVAEHVIKLAHAGVDDNAAGAVAPARHRHDVARLRRFHRQQRHSGGRGCQKLAARKFHSDLLIVKCAYRSTITGVPTGTSRYSSTISRL